MSHENENSYEVHCLQLNTVSVNANVFMSEKFQQLETSAKNKGRKKKQEQQQFHFMSARLCHSFTSKLYCVKPYTAGDVHTHTHTPTYIHTLYGHTRCPTLVRRNIKRHFFFIANCHAHSLAIDKFGSFYFL